MIANIKFTKFSTAQTMRIQRNFRKNLEIDKNQENCVNFDFQKKKKKEGKRHKTQEKKN